MSQALVNISSRMRYRNLRPSALEKRGRFNLRPRSQTFAMSRDLGGRCVIKHLGFWDHVPAHLPHGRHLGHSQARCFVIMHMFPGEAGLRTMLAAWLGKFASPRTRA
jgi:hypothetical protein